MAPGSIKALIAIRDLTTREIARAIGCLEAELSQTINGHRINPEIRKRLAAHLGVPVDEMFDEQFDAVVSYLKLKRAS